MPRKSYDRHAFIQDVSQFLAEDVVKTADFVGIGDFKMKRQIRNSALTFISEPGRRTDFLPNIADDRLVDLDPML